MAYIIFPILILMLGCSQCPAARIEKRAILIGPTGAGKSWLGNKLLGKLSFESCTSTQSITENVTSEIKDILLPNRDTLKLTIVDTPGLGDTNGRSHEFMDKIILDIRTHGANILLFLIPYGKLDPGLQNNLNALSECINGLPDSTSALVINRVPTDYELEQSDPPKTMEEIEQESINDYLKNVDVGKLSNNVFIQVQQSKLDEKFSNIIKKIHGFIAASTTVPQNTLQTWTEILEHYNGIINEKISALDAVNIEIRQVEGEIESLKTDKGWHEKRISDLKLGQNLVIWIPIAGPIIHIGIQSVVADSEAKLREIETNINRLQIVVNGLRNSAPNKNLQIEKARKHLEKVGNYLSSPKRQEL